jgi:hypothetical protein
MEGLARFGLASPSIILSRDAVCGTSDAGWRLTFTVEAIWGSILFMSPDSKPALSAPTGSKNDPKPGKNGNSGRPLFPKSHLPVFSLLFALAHSTAKCNGESFGVEENLTRSSVAEYLSGARVEFILDLLDIGI